MNNESRYVNWITLVAFLMSKDTRSTGRTDPRLASVTKEPIRILSFADLTILLTSKPVVRFVDHGLSDPKFAISLNQPCDYGFYSGCGLGCFRTIDFMSLIACHFIALSACLFQKILEMSGSDSVSLNAPNMTQKRIVVCEADHRRTLNLMQIRHHLQRFSVNDLNAAARGLDHPSAFPKCQCF